MQHSQKENMVWNTQHCKNWHRTNGMNWNAGLTAKYPLIMYSDPWRTQGRNSLLQRLLMSHNSHWISALPRRKLTTPPSAQNGHEKQNGVQEPLDLHVPSQHSLCLQEQQQLNVVTPPKAKESVAAPRKVTMPKMMLFKCDLCGKEFQQKFNLTKHNIIHSGKHFKCSGCDYSARSPYHLREHEAKCMHRTKYKCTYDGCTAIFKHRSGVYKHWKKNPWTMKCH